MKIARRITRHFLVLLGLLLGGCAGTTQFQSYPDIESASGTATVHVVRANSGFGAAVTAPVYVDRYLIGRIGPGGHITTRVPVGKVHVTSTTGDVVVQTKAGAEYYFEVAMPGQLWLYAPDFNVITISKERARSIMGS